MRGHVLSTDACKPLNALLHHCVNSSVLAVFCSNNFFTNSSSLLFLLLDALLFCCWDCCCCCCCCCWLGADFVDTTCLTGCYVVVADLTGVGSSQNPVAPELLDHAWLDEPELAQFRHCDAVPHIPAFCSTLADSFCPAFSCLSLSCCWEYTRCLLYHQTVQYQYVSRVSLVYSRSNKYLYLGDTFLLLLLNLRKTFHLERLIGSNSFLRPFEL